MQQYACAICGRTCEYSGPLPETYPFCGPRCRMVDLGRWLTGAYSVERVLTPEETAELETRRGIGRNGES